MSASDQMLRARRASDSKTREGRGQIWQLRLYVAGNTLLCFSAVENLQRICGEYFEGRVEYDVEVIHIGTQPQLARQDQIVALPTLLRLAPLPHRRVVGDLSDVEQVLQALELPRLESPCQ